MHEKGITIEGNPASRRAEILLVEDNPADVVVMKEALERTSIPNKLSVTVTGDEALDFLYKRGRFAEAARPDIILLDLNLPKTDGREVLARVKSDSGLKKIPVVILTTSDSGNDIDKCYSLYANCYVIKPIDLEEFFDAVKSIADFWLNTVTLPHRVRDEDKR